MTEERSPKQLLAALWRDYVAHAPHAERIHRLLLDRGEIVHDDHVALRTFDAPEIGVQALARPFEACGWKGREWYRFAARHLRARYWQHDDPNLPKVFISELVVDELSPRARTIIARLVAQLPPGFAQRWDLAWSGRPWRLTYADYRELLAESEHAAWVAAFGFRVDHFTLDVDALASFPDMNAVVAFLVEHAIRVDEHVVDRLVQAATRPELEDVEFLDATARIPGCHYELRQTAAPPVSVAK